MVRAKKQTGEPAQVKGATAETIVEKPTMGSWCYREKEGEIRMGDFEPPEEDVPEYEIIEENPVERGDAEAVRLLVDMRARSEGDYTLITRDIKSRYAELDATSIEFTDTTGILSYNGGASIFNTPAAPSISATSTAPRTTKATA